MAKKTSRSNRILSLIGALLITNLVLLDKEFSNKFCIGLGLGCFEVSLDRESFSMVPYPEKEEEPMPVVSTQTTVTTGQITSGTVIFNNGLDLKSLDELLVKLERIKYLRNTSDPLPSVADDEIEVVEAKVKLLSIKTGDDPPAEKECAYHSFSILVTGSCE